MWLLACTVEPHYTNYMEEEYLKIKTHGSELQGQERAKQIAKNQTRDKLLCIVNMSKRFCNMTS